MKIIAQFIKTDKPHETKLRITENKRGLRGSVLKSDGSVLYSTQFNYEDGDADIYRVKEYFGFTNDNSYKV